MTTMSSDQSSDNYDNYSILQKKSLIITLGNAGDLNSLLDMLEAEKHPEILFQIINVLGALGKKKAIPSLERLHTKTQNPTIKKQATFAIEAIRDRDY